MRGPCAGPGAGRWTTPCSAWLLLYGAVFLHLYEAIRAVLPVGLWYQVQDTYPGKRQTAWEGKTIRQKDAKAVLAFEDLGGEATYRAVRKASGRGSSAGGPSIPSK